MVAQPAVRVRDNRDLFPSINDLNFLKVRPKNSELRLFLTYKTFCPMQHLKFLFYCRGRNRADQIMIYGTK